MFLQWKPFPSLVCKKTTRMIINKQLNMCKGAIFHQLMSCLLPDVLSERHHMIART